MSEMKIVHFLVSTDMISLVWCLTCATVAVVLQSMARWFDGCGVMLTSPGYSYCRSTRPDHVVVVVVVDLIVVCHQLKMCLML